MKKIDSMTNKSVEKIKHILLSNEYNNKIKRESIKKIIINEIPKYNKYIYDYPKSIEFIKKMKRKIESITDKKYIQKGINVIFQPDIPKDIYYDIVYIIMGKLYKSNKFKFHELVV